MRITFNAAGLKFDAEVDYDPGEWAVISGPADNWCEGAPAEVEFFKLTHETSDAMFLLASHLAEEIEEAAIKAAEELTERYR
jgi:hypothetical protein